MITSHLVPLKSISTVFTPDWAMSCVVSAYDHELFGPETMLVRTLTLNTLTWARYEIGKARKYPVEDRRHKP